VSEVEAEPGDGSAPTTDARRQREARRLGEAMRLVVERLVNTSAPAEELAEAADQLEGIAAVLDPYPRGRSYDGFAESANAGNPHAFFDWSPLLGRANPLAPPIRLVEAGNRVVGHVTYGAAYEGPPGCVHGGMIAAGFDEILGVANSMTGNPGMTGTLTIRYRKPTPLYTELTYVGVLERTSGRKVMTRGELWNGDELTAEADGLFVSVGLAKFQELMAARNNRLG
jgi:acyl-coenzyme A thioesterase PaaI-like protein